jgi:hypothetical protein
VLRSLLFVRKYVVPGAKKLPGVDPARTSRFSILQRAIDCGGARQIDKYVTIVSACCVLHNFCANHNDVLDENLVYCERQFAPFEPDAADDDDAGSSLHAAALQPAALRRRFTADAKRIRDALKDYVVPPLGY